MAIAFAPTPYGSKISIVITTYNRDRYLGAAIASILRQTYANFELLIWDDGSTDASLERAQNYAAQDQRIRVVAAPHRGRTLALKAAIAQTTGDYLGWVDDDDLLSATALQTTAAVLDANSAIGMVYTDYVDMNQNGKMLGYGNRCRIPYSKHRLLVDFMTFHFRLMRRSVFEQAGGINPFLELAEDYDLCLRLSEVTEVQRLKQALYYYRNHPKNITNQHRQDLLDCSRRAIEQALQRRGLAPQWQIELHQERFILRRKTALFSPQPALPVKSAGLLLATLPFVSATGKQVQAALTNLTKLDGATTREQSDRTKPDAIPAAKRRIATSSVSPEIVTPEYSPSSLRQPREPILVAQAIAPAVDGTGTNVIQNNDRFDITGGQLSQDGANLFHSFEKFGLDPNQIANFLSNPQIQNILGRVVGGDASFINGLVQVTGGSSNLYLMNPAGIVFGANARLDVPGAFTATTATGIGFGSGWFNAIGANDYATLLGSPNSFAFALNQPGAMINAGNLAVGQGKALSLVGGVVANVGQLSAPGGQILVSAVPETSLVRISQPGSPLSLEIEALGNNGQSIAHSFNPLSLPELLTGTGNNVPGLVAIDTNQVQLATAATPIPVTAGTTILSGSVNVNNQVPGQSGGTVAILGNKVGLFNANINASGISGGGTVLVGGDYQGRGAVPNASISYISPDSVINADALTNGNGGRIIVWADDTAQIHGTLTARGGLLSGNGGLVETSGKQYLQVTRTPDVTAPQGQGGTWLIDPSNITIQNTPPILFLLAPTPLPGNPFVAIADDSTIEVSLINDALSSGADVLISTNNPTGTQVGNIIQNDDAPITPEITGSNTPTLTLRAANDIVLNSGIDVTGGSVNVNLIARDPTQGGGPTGRISINNNPNNTTSISLGSGNLSLSGDEIDFDAGISIFTTGDLLLQPTTPGQNIVIAGSGYNDPTSALDLTRDELDTILESNSFNSIAIGRTDGSGTITANSYAFNNPLTIQSPFGAINVDGVITNTDAITLRATTTTLNSDLRTRGDNDTDTIIIDSDRVLLGADVALSTVDGSGYGYGYGYGANITITGTIDGTQNLLVNAGNASVLFGGAIGSTTPLGSLFVTAQGTTVGNNITTANGNIFFDSPVTITGNAIFDAGTASITFDPVLTGSSSILAVGSNSLTLTADEIDFGSGFGYGYGSGFGVVTATGGTLVLQPSTPDLAIQLGGSGSGSSTILDLTQGDLTALADGGGFASITIGRTNGSGAITVVDDITFADPVTIQSPVGAGSINSGNSAITARASIQLLANQNITTGDITAPTGISLISNNGNIDTTNGTLLTSLGSGNAGDITITAFGDITTGDLLAPTAIEGPGDGGDVTVTSVTGAIDTSAGLVLTGGFSGNTGSADTSGNVVFSAPGNILTGAISTYASGSGNAGQVNLTSRAGAITIGDFIDAGSSNGNGGLVVANAFGDITILDAGAETIYSGSGSLASPDPNLGNGNAGAISLTSTSGRLSVLGGLSSTSVNAGGGTINLSASGDILTDTLNSSGSTIGGIINLVTTGNITTGDLIFGATSSAGVDNSLQVNTPATVNLNGTIATNGADILVGNVTAPNQINLNFPGTTLFTTGGSVLFNSTGTITLQKTIDTDGGNITLNATAIDASLGFLDASNSNGVGGAIALAADSDLRTGNLNSQGNTGGRIALTSRQGAIVSGNLDSSGVAQGGDIIVNARERIQTGTITSRASIGDGGSVTLDPINDIQVAFIDAQGGSRGRGGNVDITTQRFFRATDTFVDQNDTSASISTAGGQGGGTITIRHGGGAARVPFDVGDASDNGTAGAITNGNQPDGTIAPLRSFPGSYQQDQNRIQIITQDFPSPPENDPVTPLTELGGTTQLPCLDSSVASVESGFTSEYEKYLGSTASGGNKNLGNTCTTLANIEAETGIRPALIYATFIPESVSNTSLITGDRTQQESDQLELILVTANGKPIRKRITGVTRSRVIEIANEFRREVSDGRKTRTKSYMKSAQQLHQWLIAPLAAELQTRQVENIAFVVDAGLRSLPLAAIHDGQQFLVEQYSLGLMPSINLTDTRYVDVRKAQVLAMGASEFSDLPPLPAVPAELSILKQLWQGEKFLNQEFTRERLQAERQKQPFGIVHLATHGEFQPGDPGNSFIQLWNDRLQLDQLRQLGLSDPPAQLLVLSACRTALGDRERLELGFAGLAVQSGAKSALGSLWYVSDVGTLGLMTQFYQQLQQAPLKAEALRQAQIAMLTGKVRLEDGQLQGLGQNTIPLPPDLAASDNGNLAHPFYWAPFTVIGNPW